MPCSSGNLLANEDKMKVFSILAGIKYPLLLISGNFEFYCIQLENPMGIANILVFFPMVGIRVQSSFPKGMKF